MSPLRVLAVEPWLGGSHRAFLASWRERSAHAVDVLGLAPRSWKWRMTAGAWELARLVRERDVAAADVLVVSDYVDLPALLGWLPSGWNAPTLAYFHENQLTYPVRDVAADPDRDLHHGFTNVLTCLRADAVAFNSRYHRDAFAAAADELLARLPKPNPRRELAARLAAAHVVAPGVELDRVPLGPGAPAGSPLRVAFNHRWEHDKDPAAFLRAVRDALDRGARIELALFGERFDELPSGVAERLDALAPAIVASGYVAERATYAERLGACDVAVSTARHEFYGIAALEAVAAGCAPLLPRRLSYPEILPPALHPEALYDEDEDLTARLAAAAEHPERPREPARRRALRDALTSQSAHRTAVALDRLCTDLARKA